jgi:hypothetical protein
MNMVNRILPIPKSSRQPANGTTIALRAVKLLYALSCFALPFIILLITLQLALPFFNGTLLVIGAILLVCLITPLPLRVENRLPASFVRIGPRLFFLYTEGFLMMNEDASRCHVVHWSELEEFWINKKSQYIVRLMNGLLVKIDTRGAQSRALTDRIEHEVAQRYAPEALTLYKQGRLLSFGRVRVSTQGMQVDDGFQVPSWHALAWDEIARVHITFPHLLKTDINAFMIYCKDSHRQGQKRRYLVYLKDIPNISVLQEIMKMQNCSYRRGTLVLR